MRTTSNDPDCDALLKAFDVYDRSVDLVSLYQWLFTDTQELPGTVAHFERYPRLQGHDGNPATPDFTVLYTDGTGLVAEIANIALPSQSIDKVCKQLDRYSRLNRLPSGKGSTAPVTLVDVVLLNPVDTAAAANRRVFTESLDDASHWFQPLRRPVLVSYALLPDKYSLQTWPSQQNGTFNRGDYPKTYADFRDAFNVPPDAFKDFKINHPFMNDPIPPLYLATRLWTSVFPSLHGGRGAAFTTTTDAIVDALQDLYSRGTAQEVQQAMHVLRLAGLVNQDRAGAWILKRINLHTEDAHKSIAERIRPKGAETSIAPRKPRRRDPAAQALPGQDVLFDS